MKIQVIFVLLFCKVYSLSIDNNQPKVHYKNGWIVGKTFKTANLKEFDGFFGIPFAKPPVGELRLRDPQPFTDMFSEENPLNATEEKQMCAQKNYLMPNPFIMGVEDCLYLYVYRPKISSRRRKMPVIVYIHGGGWFAGAAGPSLTGGDYFMDTEEVILVTMSYRLGPLGFLSTGDANMSGNFGLKDQALALRWVNENIEFFGGDPNNVAIMGQSAGAASVHLHMMSDLSRNLFQKAIALSGNGNAPYAYVLPDPLSQAQSFAKAAGINISQCMTNSQLSNELRKVNVDDLLNASDALKFWSVDPLVINRPVIEDCRVVDGFLCDDPVKMWRDGNYNKIPFLTGFMDGDGAVRALAALSDQNQLNQLNENFQELFPKLLEIDDPKSQEVTDSRVARIVNKYLNGKYKLSSNDWKVLVEIYTYRSFVAPMANTLLQMLQNDEKSQAYLYKFSFKGMFSYSFLYTGTFNDFGAVHCDELIYLFKSPLIFPSDFPADSREAKFRQEFVRYFTSFVTYGKPKQVEGGKASSCTRDETLGKGINQLLCNYVHFNDTISVKTNEAFDSNAVNFWNSIDDTLIA